jgi:hypothetical protein
VENKYQILLSPSGSQPTRCTKPFAHLSAWAPVTQAENSQHFLSCIILLTGNSGTNIYMTMAAVFLAQATNQVSQMRLACSLLTMSSDQKGGLYEEKTRNGI